MTPGSGISYRNHDIDWPDNAALRHIEKCREVPDAMKLGVSTVLMSQITYGE